MARPRKDGKKSSGKKETPLMKQYYAIKAQHPGTILLFRVGDFYETFGEDAVEVSQVLGIVLTKRANGAASHIELAGFPHHSLDTYLPKLVRSGKRVAVCDQLEDPKQAKGIVKRGVTELVTPGVTFNDKVLDSNRNNYLASIHIHNTKQVGVAFVEVSTGDFFCFSGNFEYAEKVLQTLSPSEVLVSRSEFRQVLQHFGEKLYLSRLDDWVYQYDYAREKLLDLLQTTSLKGFGIEDDKIGTIAAGSIVHYLNETQQKNLGHISRIYPFDDSEFVWLDPFTIRNLELVHPLHPDGKALVDVIDQCLTPMGARGLRRAILLPLKDIQQIQKRLDTVETFLKHQNKLHELVDHFQQLGDLERLASKVATQRINPRESTLLRDSLRQIAPIQHTLQSFDAPILASKADSFSDATPALSVLDKYLLEEVSANLMDGQVIRGGVSEELDELRAIKRNGKDLLLAMQQREVERTGITSLKIGFNKVFGYYLEVTHAHKDKVPVEWTRKQTLTSAERYITEELKDYEEKILNAEERIQTLETQLYQQFLHQMQLHLHTLQHNAKVIAELDMLLGFARVAQSRQYVKPIIQDDDSLDIKQGRHPVIETTLPADSPYIPNDIQLDNESQQIIIITGPNMAGKSALLRQTALITLMAQMGCFVPADAAQIGIVDKIFTRVGASDNISSGESTFMVEMNETAQIANNATSKSLILLDEIGRGTSTYDGVSIAWALVEYLHETPSCQAKTLFATHYHELNELENRLPRVKNFNVSVKEIDGKILFLRTLKPGGSEHSFGINVAAMAGMPSTLVKRAKNLLKHFEQNRIDDKQSAKSVKFSSKPTVQLNMFELKDADTLKIRNILAGSDIDRMTPVEALLKLQEIKQALMD
ncbi:DNA mismatch repair protein MutS [Pontibacter sp. G13]|uniref:DNA mismatch repair protein MutS n=1 Tax=Pontibacter sp. G13 TaxID=3074898 RepID=UPI0028895E4C|nr:DNA mismatch repair protein MutS [Pontibacter sp. G13]WNJ16847.1 DNA mismatch repair protein MutS [Pontibacter sp. G13]